MCDLTLFKRYVANHSLSVNCHLRRGSQAAYNYILIKINLLTTTTATAIAVNWIIAYSLLLWLIEIAMAN